MKKSLLLYTVSAVLFYSHSSLSYALNTVTHKTSSDVIKMHKNRSDNYIHPNLHIAPSSMSTMSTIPHGMNAVTSHNLIPTSLDVSPSPFQQTLQNALNRAATGVNLMMSKTGRYGSKAHERIMEQAVRDVLIHTTNSEIMANIPALENVWGLAITNIDLMMSKAGKYGSDDHARAVVHAIGEVLVNAIGEVLGHTVDGINSHALNEIRVRDPILDKALNSVVDSILTEAFFIQSAQNLSNMLAANQMLLNTPSSSAHTHITSNALGDAKSNTLAHNTSMADTNQPLNTDDRRQVQNTQNHYSNLQKTHNEVSQDSSITNQQYAADVNSPSRVDVAPQSQNTPSPAPKTALNVSPNVNVNVPLKIDATAQTTVDAKKSSNLRSHKENEILSNADPDPEEQTRAFVQRVADYFVRHVANYLVMPHALFVTGFADMSNQSALLDNIRITMFEPTDNKKRKFFLSSYGNKITHDNKIKLLSNKPLKYGYSNDIRYTALQAGATLLTLEDQNITTNFGLLGTYGKLTFSKSTENSEKSTFDKWLFTTYGNIQHDSGVYLSAFLSYGIFKGNITTILIKNSTKINDAKTLGASATIGQKLVTDFGGLIFEPQAQLIYQHLTLGTFLDANDLEVDMSNPRQWLLRLGGRLTKNDGDAVSLYSKLNIIKAFADKHTIKINDTAFHLDTIGSSIEGGLGVNAQLSPNITLHADISYQHKLKESSISGITLSGGMHYRF
ncbi:autotransporter outer membrane beta-barrel domain-containing protein [Bartonella sp. B35(2025)]